MQKRGCRVTDHFMATMSKYAHGHGDLAKDTRQQSVSNRKSMHCTRARLRASEPTVSHQLQEQLSKGPGAEKLTRNWSELIMRRSRRSIEAP